MSFEDVFHRSDFTISSPPSNKIRKSATANPEPTQEKGVRLAPTAGFYARNGLRARRETLSRLEQRTLGPSSSAVHILSRRDKLDNRASMRTGSSRGVSVGESSVAPPRRTMLPSIMVQEEEEVEDQFLVSSKNASRQLKVVEGNKGKKASSTNEPLSQPFETEFQKSASPPTSTLREKESEETLFVLTTPSPASAITLVASTTAPGSRCKEDSLDRASPSSNMPSIESVMGLSKGVSNIIKNAECAEEDQEQSTSPIPAASPPNVILATTPQQLDSTLKSPAFHPYNLSVADLRGTTPQAAREIERSVSDTEEDKADAASSAPSIQVTPPTPKNQSPRASPLSLNLPLPPRTPQLCPMSATAPQSPSPPPQAPSPISQPPPPPTLHHPVPRNPLNIPGLDAWAVSDAQRARETWSHTFPLPSNSPLIRGVGRGRGKGGGARGRILSERGRGAERGSCGSERGRVGGNGRSRGRGGDAIRAAKPPTSASSTSTVRGARGSAIPVFARGRGSARGVNTYSNAEISRTRGHGGLISSIPQENSTLTTTAATTTPPRSPSIIPSPATIRSPILASSSPSSNTDSPSTSTLTPAASMLTTPCTTRSLHTHPRGGRYSTWSPGTTPRVRNTFSLTRPTTNSPAQGWRITALSGSRLGSGTETVRGSINSALGGSEQRVWRARNLEISRDAMEVSEG